MTSRLILASASPRRHELLRLLGIPFEVVAPVGVDESIVSGSAYARSQELARRKAEWVLARTSEPDRELRVVGADTLIALESGGEERVLGKPKDIQEARGFLRALSGTTHRVMTGIAVLCPSRPSRVAAEVSLVTFRHLSDSDLDDYLSTGEPLGRAGAYGIEGDGRRLIAGIRGCYYNVVGLPVRLLAEFLPRTEPYVCDCAGHALQKGLPGCRSDRGSQRRS